ncbi:MAG: response regulator [Anaerolineales bacterium]|nr:response regulator [Anaerolineales bacterium]
MNKIEKNISQVYTQNIYDAARWSVLGLASITIVYAYLGWELHAWQFYSTAIVTAIGTAAASLNFLPSLKMSPCTRINLLLLSTEIVILLEMLFLKGLGWILALTIVLVSTIIFVMTMQKPNWKLILRSMLMTLLTLLLDFFGPAYRLPVQGLFLWEYVYTILVVVFGVAIIYNFGWNLKNQSLRTRIITTFGFAAMVIILGVAYFLNQSERKLLQTEANAQLKQQATTTALFIDMFLQEELEKLAQIGEQTAVSASHTQLDTNLDTINALNPAYSNLWLIDTDNTIIAQTTVQPVTAVFPTDRPSVGDPIYIDGEYHIILSVPVWNESKTAVTGTLAADYNLQPLFSLLNKNQSAAIQLLTPAGAISLSKPGTPVRQSPLSEDQISNLLAADAYTEKSAASDDSSQLLSLAAIDGETAANNPNWYILLEQPADQTLRNNSEQENFNILIGMAGTVLFFLIAIYFSHHIVQPIHQLTDAAAQVTAGNLNVRINIDTNNEMGVLANAFNNMTHQLKNHVNELETRVKERTVALSLANTQLAGSELRYRALATLVTDYAAVLLLKSGTLHIDWLSKQVQSMLGNIEDVSNIASHLETIIDPEDQAAAKAMFEEVLTGKKSSVDLRLNLTPEQTIWLQVHAQSFAEEGNPDERKIYVAGQDITQQRQAQIALNQAERLHSLGVLAGGIAHDFNNLLTGILGQASLVKIHAEHNRPITKNLDSLTKAAERAAELTQKLLAYAGKGRYELSVINLNSILADNHVFLQTLIPPHVDIHLNLAPHPMYVKVDPGQIQQVIMNLILNAANACSPKGGIVTIETDSFTFTADDAPQTIAQTPLEAGIYQKLVVIDNGVGMSPETLTKIFEPFFTTRPHGRGLGLSATLGIIKAHHGGLQVKSRLNIGTTFTIFLPTAQAPDSRALPVAKAIRQQRGKALVIDDEVGVRDVAADGLKILGFQVITAANGKEGLQKYQSCADDLQIILVDMKMPVMNGAGFLAQLRQVDANTKVIFSSGYSETEIDSYLRADGNLWFLQKPYTIKNLQKLVEQILMNQ